MESLIVAIELDFAGENAVRPLPQLAEGDYPCEIVSWETVEPQKSETKGKGKNLRVKFKLDNPIQTDEKTGEDAEFNMTFNDQIFYLFDNPFALVPLLSAVKKTDPDNPKELGRVDIEEPSEFIGEVVMVRLKRKPANDGSNKTYLNPVSDAYYAVPF